MTDVAAGGSDVGDQPALPGRGATDDIFEIVYCAAVTVTGDQHTANEIAKKTLRRMGATLTTGQR